MASGLALYSMPGGIDPTELPPRYRAMLDTIAT